MKNIFRFTFRQQLRSRTFRSISIVVAAIAFLLPAALIPLTYTPPEEAAGGSAAAAPSAPLMPETVYVASDASDELDFSFLEMDPLPGYEGCSFVLCANEDEACAKAEGDPAALVLSIRETDEGLTFMGLCPKESALDTDSAKALALPSVRPSKSTSAPYPSTSSISPWLVSAAT